MSEELLERIAISWNPFLNGWISAALLTGVIVLFLIHSLQESELTKVRRFVLRSLRVAAILTLAVVLLRPELVHEKMRARKSPIYFFLDSSGSMHLKDPKSGVSRWSLLLSAIEHDRDAIERLRKTHEPRFILFGDGTRERSLDELLRPQAGTERFRSTEIQKSLHEVFSRVSEGDLQESALIVASDWQDLEPADLAATIPETIRRTRWYQSISVDPPELKDLSIKKVLAVPYGYAKNPAMVRVIIENTGMGSVVVPVSIIESGRVMAVENVSLSNGAETEVSVKYLNGGVGDHAYQVSIPVLEGEATGANNSWAFQTRVVRDKIRVLHVSGRPSWDQHFLREFLVGNPEIELISFYILRTIQNDPDASTSELSLIPFPYEELFTKEIRTFDVIIFQNFNSRGYFRDEYLTNIKNYVREGGAFFMIGGEQSFALGGYAGTPLEEILPVRLSITDGASNVPVRPRFRAGKLGHPLVRGVLDLDQLRHLPEFWGFNLVSSIHSWGDAILEDPLTGLPILAAGDVEKGRVVALMVDSLWRWRMLPSDDQRKTYDELLKRTLRWLTHDPFYEPCQVAAEKGKPVQVECFASERRHDLTYQVSRISERGEDQLEFSDGLKPKRAAKTDSALRWSYPFDWAAKGIRRLTVTQGGEKIAERVIIAEDENHEYRSVGVNADLYERVIRQSKSRERVIRNRGESLVADLEPRSPVSGIVIGRDARPLWDKWWVLAIFLSVLLVLWGLARRWNI